MNAVLGRAGGRTDKSKRYTLLGTPLHDLRISLPRIGSKVLGLCQQDRDA